ncbi:hypothetical protein [Hyphomicrobium sp.]|uniref:glucosamine inositolphosphorylceramide transferase family protein n=1 Tax=Hyphomicrobium sp. TaxID=82 RepID=UPI0025BA4563|nr:hypothetical protein [Hyphomicrobium sp.]
MLVARLLEEGHDIALFVSDVDASLPAALSMTLTFERLVYGISGKSLIASIGSDEGELGALARVQEKSGLFDVVVRLDGAETNAPKGRRVVRPLFNGIPSEAGALDAALDERELAIAVEELARPDANSKAYAVETELPAILSKTLNDACGRMIDLLAWECESTPLRPGGALTSNSAGGNRAATSPARPIVLHAVTTLSRRLTRRLDTLARGGDRWAIAWRDAARTPFDPSGGATTIAYQRIADDGRRFLADPFPVVAHDHAWIFCEEYPYATGKGIISVIDLNDPKMPARPVIEEPHHLSYPMIFIDGGQWWMIPEAGASNRISLYRCEAFPHKWVRETVLIENVAASDPTLYRDKRGYWLFFTLCAGSGSPSDRLCLFHSPSLRGPWAPCGAQPLAIDPKTSRPAGHIIDARGTLYRPAQDCMRRYGGAMVWSRFTLPGDHPFSQVEVGTLRPRDGRALLGGHTYNRFGSIEAVDIFGAPRSDLVEFVYETTAVTRGSESGAAKQVIERCEEQTYASN